jgi:hypothetical protein
MWIRVIGDRCDPGVSRQDARTGKPTPSGLAAEFPAAAYFAGFCVPKCGARLVAGLA